MLTSRSKRKGTTKTKGAAILFCWLLLGLLIVFSYAHGKGVDLEKIFDRQVNDLTDPATIEQSGVRATIGEILMMVDEYPENFDELMAALEVDYATHRKMGILILKKYRDVRSVEPLIVLLKDYNAIVRNLAARTSGRIGDPRLIDPLIESLGVDSSRVREGAAEALGEARDARAVDPLIAALKDRSSHVREQAADALGKIKSTKAVESLLALFDDSSSHVRERAAWALGETKDIRAIDPLIEALGDDPNVREEVAEALEKITGQDLGQDQERWRDWRRRSQEK